MNLKLSTRDICVIGVSTAFLCILAQITIPMPYGVPLTLQTFAMSIVGIVVGAKNGTISSIIYIILGMVGLPIFSGFKGGIGSILGPTGGFILSFPLMTLISGLGIIKNNKVTIWIGLIIAFIVNYIVGMFYFSFITKNDLKFAFVACVLPFLITDLIKLIIIGIIGPKLKKRLNQTISNIK